MRESGMDPNFDQDPCTLYTSILELGPGSNCNHYLPFALMNSTTDEWDQNGLIEHAY